MKIYAPVANANGVWCSVLFVNGVGETDNPHLIRWFKEHGYRIEDSNFVIQPQNEVIDEVLDQIDNEPNFDAMNPNELRDWMKANGYGREIKNIRNKEKLLEIIRG